MWSTGFMAAYVVYRYHRVLDAILLLGAALIANMSATLTDLFGHLLLFVIAALLLWLRAALVTRQDGWQRRRVNETSRCRRDHAVGDRVRRGERAAGLDRSPAWPWPRRSPGRGATSTACGPTFATSSRASSAA
jgi:hypothetical protein